MQGVLTSQEPSCSYSGASPVVTQARAAREEGLRGGGETIAAPFGFKRSPVVLHMPFGVHKYKWCTQKQV